MRFSAEWVAGGENASAEERSTLCELSVFVGERERNVATFYDSDEKAEFESILLPAVHLAEGIASNWWQVFGGRDVEHRVLAWRTGFALPDIRLAFDGARLTVRCLRSEMVNPELTFLHGTSESLKRRDAERALTGFVDQVVAKLAADDVSPTEVGLAWDRVAESREDAEESAFCEAAGALGKDPYAIAEADADFIEKAASRFNGEALVEFLAGVRQHPSTDAHRADLIEWVSRLRPRSRTHLPDLAPLAQQLNAARPRHERRPPWQRGVRIAKACRTALDIHPTASTSIKQVSEKLGGTRLASQAGPPGIYALVATDDDGVHVHLRHRGSAGWARDAEKFAFARAVGDAICFPDTPRAPINSLREAERQATGRAFAAEFTAPVEPVMQMWREGMDVDDIAGHFGVNSQVVDHQIENSTRTLPVVV